MKSLSARTVSEIMDIFEEYSIDLPDTDGGIPTKKELLTELELLGINSRTLKSWESKKDVFNESIDKNNSEPTALSDEVIVRMTRRNPIFQWKGHKFSKEHCFVPMKKDEAFDLIQSFSGFHISNRKEVKRYYR